MTPKWNRVLFAVIAPLVVVVFLTLTTAPPAHTQGPPGRPVTPVQVVNTPLPVTGNLNATVAGTVQVGNTLLPVQAMNDALNEPYSAAAVGSMQDSESQVALAFDIPDGKRLVIETITVEADVPPGQTPLAQLITSVNGNAILRRLAVAPQGVFGGAEISIGTHPITVRVDGTPAGNEVVIVFRRSFSAGQASGRASVDGYLVDL